MAADLSVAIIFKNEIRCLERCLKSLQPLKERLGCEIVMADTGSTDGSRAVAEKYADVVFDFPWINDFAAARNAVLERCSGAWTMVMDSDEWLDRDVGELVSFVKNGAPAACTAAALPLHNYTTKELDHYIEHYQPRLFRMAAKPRYQGAIHESVVYGNGAGETLPLHKMILHHDGYVMLNDGSEAGKAKRARNMALLRKELERAPEDFRVRLEWLESGSKEPDFEQVLRRTVELIREKKSGWKEFGPPVMRVAIGRAIIDSRMASQIDEWAAFAESEFADSYLTQIDINYQLLILAQMRKDWGEVVRRGSDYLRVCRKFRRDKKENTGLLYATLNFGDEPSEQEACIALAEAYVRQKDYDNAREKLGELAFGILTANQTLRAVDLAAELCAESELEPDALINALWNGICEETPNAERAKERKRAFVIGGGKTFSAKRENADGKAAWEMFLPLAGECVLGDAAALMRCESAEDADAILETVDEPAELPAAALAHALKMGAAFPIPGKPLTVEKADTIAAQMAADKDFLREAALFAASAAEDDQDLIWARALTLAALQCVDWERDEEPQAVLYAFARVESAFLPRCYSEHALRASEYLPPMYRFALHLSNALAVITPTSISPEFQPTAGKDIRTALAELKHAVEAAPELKRAVDWLLDDILRRNG